MSSMLNQKHTLTKLRAELEGRPGKLCYECKKFGHLACDYRKKKEEEMRMLVPQNRFEMLLSRVMRCGVEIRKQERERKEEEAIWCFKCRCKKAKLQAGIKPTTLCSVIDKENSIESLLDLLYYIYNYYCGYASCFPQSSCSLADFFVTCCDCDYDDMTVT